MIPPREGWKGRQHTQTSDAPLVLQYVALGASHVVYLDRSEVKEQDFRCWTNHHLSTLTCSALHTP